MQKVFPRIMIYSLFFFLTACAATSITQTLSESSKKDLPTSIASKTSQPTVEISETIPTSTTKILEEQPLLTSTLVPTSTAEVDFSKLWEIPQDILLGFDETPRFAEFEFKTDFSKHSVYYTEILSGGPPRDGIPSIDQPKFMPIETADIWLEPVEPVLAVQVGQDAHAYPIQILMWHEIVNDTVGGLPLTITFCPLCNTGIAFERSVLGHVLDFGTTGRLRFSNLIMYDRQSETWWQQASGEAIVGSLTGYQLTFYPVSMISWAQFKEAFPHGQVLSQDTGSPRRYGENPYLGNDDINNAPFLYVGPETSDKLLPMARVLTLDLEAEAVAYPYKALEKAGVINDSVSGLPVAIFWQPNTASALDAGQVSAGRDVGSAAAYSRIVNGQTLTFTLEDTQILDLETNSQWNLLGQATSGPLAGETLEPLPAINHFWFSWAAFKPDTRIYSAK